MRDALRARLDASGLRRRIRRLGRIRWLTKRKVLARHGASPVRHWRYLLSDPEVDSFTYAIANEDELARQLAPVLDAPPEALTALLDEAHRDGLLTRALRQPPRHWLWSKRRPEPRAHHLALWTAIRSARPDVVVETGILDGMSSTVMLAALEANGHGTLISFDIMPGAGAMVPAWLRPRWEPVYDDMTVALEDALSGRTVDIFTSDSVATADHIRAEFDAALPHAGERFWAFTAWGQFDVLGWTGAEVLRFQERPRDHFYGGTVFAAARIR